MSELAAYDAQVRAIRAYNQPILDDFRTWLEQSGLSAKTVRGHVNNIAFFTEYLVYYEPLKKLDEANSSDVRMFLANWFPRKALWASEGTVKSNIASFKKFFQWMGETDRVSPQTVTDVLTTLKDGRDHFLKSVTDYNSYPRFTQ
jgi:site-specific recombinase XerD